MTRKGFGSKGEWWVVAQFVFVPLVLLVTVLARTDGNLSPVLRAVTLGLTVVFALYAAVIFLWGVLHLGNNLTAVPHPKEEGFLVQSGAYAIVRHPIYSGVIFAVLAWSLLFLNWLGLALWLVVLLFFDRKSKLEESWLTQKYADYAAYQQRVKKLIPFIY